MKRIETEWENFRATCVPSDASPAHVAVSRACFYAGAACLFKVVMNMLSPGAEPTAADIVKMDELFHELPEGFGFMLMIFSYEGKELKGLGVVDLRGRN
jgi:hypothetical protein